MMSSVCGNGRWVGRGGPGALGPLIPLGHLGQRVLATQEPWSGSAGPTGPTTSLGALPTAPAHSPAKSCWQTLGEV